MDQQALLQLEAASLPPTERPVLVGDYTAWARAQARTLRDRTFEHQPVVIKGQKPITIGHGYSTLGLVPETSSSWFLPLLHERIPSATHACGQAGAAVENGLRGVEATSAGTL